MKKFIYALLCFIGIQSKAQTIDPTFNFTPVTTYNTSNDFVTASATQLNNGELLFAQGMSDGLAMFQQVIRTDASGNSLPPNTALSANSKPVIIKRLPDNRYMVVSLHQGIVKDTLEIGRYLSNGNADPSFTNFTMPFENGYITGDYPFLPYDLIVLHDNSILFSTSEYDIPNFVYTNKVWKLTPSGIVDLNFGTNGVVTPGLDVAVKFTNSVGNIVLKYENIAMLEDQYGRVYIGGQKNQKKCLTRYSSQGVFDTGYGFNTSSDTGSISKLVLDYSGDIIAFGNNKVFNPTYNAYYYTGWFIKKFHEDGSLNTSFGVGGQTNYNAGALSNAWLLYDGSFLLVGNVDGSGVDQNSPFYDHIDSMTARKFSSNGILNPSWNVIYSPICYSTFTLGLSLISSTLQTDGKFLLSYRRQGAGCIP